MKVAKIKKLDEVEKIETKEEVKEETTEAIKDVVETPVENTDEVVEDPTEAETLPKVEFKEETTPKGYSPIIHKEDKKQVLKMKDGKVYQEIGNGLGMFLADGKVFRL
jgi:hypothetical protein